MSANVHYRRHFVPPGKDTTSCNLLVINPRHPRYTADLSRVDCQRCVEATEEALRSLGMPDPVVGPTHGAERPSEARTGGLSDA